MTIIIKKKTKFANHRFLKGGSNNMPKTNKSKDISKKPNQNTFSNIQKKDSLFLQINEIIEIINAENLVGSLYNTVYNELNKKIKDTKEDKHIKYQKYLDENNNLDHLTFSKMMMGKLNLS